MWLDRHGGSRRGLQRLSLRTAANGGVPSTQQEAEAPLHKKMFPAVSTKRQIIEEPREGTTYYCDTHVAAARNLVKSKSFDIAIGVAILLNAVSIGVEQSLQIHGHSTVIIQVVESMFLCLYIFELGTRLLAFGCEAFKDNWVKFDFFLIVIGILNTWILEPSLEDDSPDALGLMMVLRVLRLLRVVKSARLFKQIAELWRLIRGFLNSVTIMIYTLMIVFFVLYVFSSLAVELITKHKLNTGSKPDPAFQAHVNKHFSSLPQTLMTLVQFVTLDDMNTIYRPLIEKDAWLSLYFILLMLVISIVLMNLVSAVIFSSTLEMEQDEHDEVQKAQEEEWAKLIRDLKVMFTRLDVDSSGFLSRDEILCMDPADRDVLVEALGVSTPEKVFNALDVDRNGSVSINEFFDGIWDVVLAKGSVDLKRLEKQVETMHWRIKETFSIQHELRMSLDRVVRIMDNLYDQTGDMCSNVKMSSGGSNTGSISRPGMMQPAWAKELNESMQQLLKEKTSSAKRTQRPSAALREKEVDQSSRRSFRDHLKDQSKAERISISLDRNDPVSPTSPTNQIRKEVTSVITAMKVESTTVEAPVEPQSPQPLPERKTRLKKATVLSDEAKEVAARLRALEQDPQLKTI